jgi:D-inositol-3-phosphate glycosyltransferase
LELEKVMNRTIALISEHASPLAELGGVDFGGQNVYVAQVARHLAAMGDQVDVFTRKDQESLPEILEWENRVRVIHVPAGPPEYVRKEELLPFMAAFRDYLIAFMEAQSYDLIHANFWMSGWVAAELKKRLNIPFVMTFHALGRVRRVHQKNADDFPDERFAIEDRLVIEADHLIAECPQDREDLIQLYHANPAKISLAPCGFDPAELWPMDKAAARRRLGLPVRGRIILQLGRMVPRKGVDNAIRGLAQLIQQHQQPAELVIVGGDSENGDPAHTPELGRLLKIAQEKGVAEHVRFVGRKTRSVLRYFYSAADVFVSTPWYEPFGITPVEAMACGTPVIGSSVGGIKFSVVDGETGFLVQPNQPEELACRMAQLFNSPALARRFRRQAVQRANELFTWEKVTATLAEIYERVLVENTSAISAEINQVTILNRAFFSAQEALQKSQELLGAPILQAAHQMVESLSHNHKLMVCGNGGSAADAIHFSAELVGRFIHPQRLALPVIALTADLATITAWANDVGYAQVFTRQVEAFGQPGDCLVAISTSGNSENLIEAFRAAQKKGIACIALLGGDGGNLLPFADHAIVIPAADKQRIQEVQILALHVICELIENHFVPRENMSASLDAAGTQPGWDLQPESPALITTYQPDK